MTQPSNVILFDTIRNRKTMTQNPIFPHLTRDDWHAIFDHGDFVSFDDQAVILHEGIQNSALFYIDEGEVRIVRHEWGGKSNSPGSGLAVCSVKCRCWTMRR